MIVVTRILPCANRYPRFAAHCVSYRERWELRATPLAMVWESPRSRANLLGKELLNFTCDAERSTLRPLNCRRKLSAGHLHAFVHQSEPQNATFERPRR